MANKVKEAWKAGRAVVNGWLAIPNAFSAEMFAQAGWDSVTVDMQHGVQDYLSWSPATRACSAPRTCCPWCACRGTSPASSARCWTPAPTA